MAKKTTRQEQIEQLVKVRRQGAAFGFGLPVNPDFASPNEVDQLRGVEPDAPEQDLGERAIAARTLRELVPATAAGIRVWILRQQRRYGRQRLEEELMAMAPLPENRDPKKYRLALRRALERSGPPSPKKVGRVRKEEHAKKGVIQPEYRHRMELLALRQSQVVLGVYGLWAYVTEGERDEHYNRMWTDPSDPEEAEGARAIIAAGGSGHTHFVWEMNDRKTVGSATLVLVKLHGLNVQVDPRGA